MAAALSLSDPMALLGQSSRCSLSSSFAGESLTVGKNFNTRIQAGMSKQSLVLRAQPVARMQGPEGVESNLSASVKRVAIAAAATLLLSTPAINVSSAYAADAATDILNSAKQTANDSFAQAQRTGAETVGQAASAPREKAPPALSQVDPSVDEASEPKADQIASRADFGADSAPGTTQQEGKATNPIEKAFATPTRGIGDKVGEADATITNSLKKRSTELPGQDLNSIGQNPGIIDGIRSSLRDAGNARDEGKGKVF